MGILAVAWLALPELAQAQAPIPPPPERWVTDEVGFLSPLVRAELDGRLEAYEQQTGHQVVVWIGDTIGGADLADWAVRTFEAWQVGQAGQDDGLVMFVLAEDRLIDIEVGYGLEDRVPDVVANRVIQEVMVPRLQVDDRDGAVSLGVDALLTAIEGQPFEGAPAPAPAPEPEARPLTLGEKILLGVGGLLFLILFITNPRLALWLLWGLASRAGRGGEGGGGFQGGGGRSGGGGARGSW